MIGSLRRAANRFARGIVVGPAVITVRRRGRQEIVDDAWHHVLRRHVRRLAELFPELSAVVQPVLAVEPHATESLFDFCNEFLPLIYGPARETQKRNLLLRLCAALHTEEAERSLRLAIARSDLRSGVPERATSLAALEDDDPVRGELDRSIEDHERLYGARAGMIYSLQHWNALRGDPRGRSLIAVLDRRLEELRGKRLLHVSPESELRAWLDVRAAALGIDYVTFDAHPGADMQGDLTELSVMDGRFDYVICHRVLEHVLDDRAALSEIRRVLRPGGVLSVSVPQSMQLADTNEWVIPDETHHGHVRQYGRDFEQLLAKAGFDVEVDRTLLDRTLEEHLAAGTYPMRVYVCRRSGSASDSTESRKGVRA
ncbi:MAG: class I SAM-dependent methyltransferase [Gaiellaceae bacterium]